MKNMIIQLTNENFEEIVLKNDLPVLVDFWASWCGPCKRIAPILESLADEVEGKAIIAKLEVDDEPAIADSYQIMSIPTILIFKDGKITKQLIGLHGKDTLKKHLGL
ncbi:thioredoxin [Mycoplasmatota bacterium]|nr:thioredoxin [Mycoplasmatota bacterium]